MRPNQEQLNDRSLSVGPYDPRAFDSLNQFRSSKLLLARNRHFIRNVGDVFVRHEVQRHFALSLLHKHFDLYGDEVVYRTFDDAGLVATMRPAATPDDAVPYLWRAVQAPRGQWQFAPLEFVRRSDDVDGAPSNLMDIAPFLQDFANTLEELNLHNIFGLCTLNILRIPVGVGDLLVETTDSEKRILTVTVEPRLELQIEELTETLWTFTPPATEHIGQVAVCKGAHCAGHCRNHCTGHCVGHCKSHQSLPS